MIPGKTAQYAVQGGGEIPVSPIVECLSPVGGIFCVIQSYHAIQESDAYPGTNSCFGKQSPFQNSMLKRRTRRTHTCVPPVVAFVDTIDEEYKQR